MTWVFTLAPLVFLALLPVRPVIEWVGFRRRMIDAARCHSWSEMTSGQLELEGRGPLLTLWASGRSGRGRARLTAAANFVAVDEVAMVVASKEPTERQPRFTCLRRADEPTLHVRRAWLGPTVSEHQSGMMVEWRRFQTSADVASTLRGLGWDVVED